MSLFDAHVGILRTYLADEYPDSCVATRYDFTSPTFNETTGETEYPTSTPYSGECIYRPTGTGETDFGEDRRQEIDGTLRLPHDAPILEELDEVVVTSTTDPDIPTLTILRRVADTYLTEAIYECKAVVDD
jgi:hypothetical protein